MIVVNRNLFVSFEDVMLGVGDKSVILNCWYWGLDKVQDLYIHIPTEFKLPALIANINKLYTLKNLSLKLDAFEGEPLLEIPENLTEISNLRISFTKAPL